MRVLLTGTPEVELETLATPFRRLAVEAVLAPLGQLAGGTAEGFQRAMLVHPSSGVVSIGEHASRLAAWLRSEVPLTVACPQLPAADRAAVRACGAARLITPASWRPGAIAERILSELIADGELGPSSLGSLQGGSEPMRTLYRELSTVAPLNEPVLILGETGTGKELVARELHRLSERAGGLLAINCAALTPELLESELFGHERGAFSGAVASRKGLLVEAGPGTVFLDEVGDLAPQAQAKLLRVLEERKVRPVGGNHWHPVHARIALATHRDLESAARAGTFRQDLLERIRGFALHLPPLRERKADLVLLCRHFVAEYNREYGGARTIPDGATDPLFRHSWPGNVRELRNVLRRAAAFAEGETGPISVIGILDLIQRSPERDVSHSVRFDPAVDSWHVVQERARSHYFRTLLQETGGNKEVAVQRAGISRSQFYEILKQLGKADEPA